MATRTTHVYVSESCHFLQSRPTRTSGGRAPLALSGKIIRPPLTVCNYPTHSISCSLMCRPGTGESVGFWFLFRPCQSWEGWGWEMTGGATASPRLPSAVRDARKSGRRGGSDGDIWRVMLQKTHVNPCMLPRDVCQRCIIIGGYSDWFAALRRELEVAGRSG